MTWKFERMAKVRITDAGGRVKHLGLKLALDGQFRLEAYTAYGQDPKEFVFWNVFFHFMKEYFQQYPYDKESSDLKIGAPYRFINRLGISGCEDWAIEVAHDNNFPAVHRNMFHVSMYGKMNEGVSTKLSFLLALASLKGVSVSANKKFVMTEDGEESQVGFFFVEPRSICCEEGWEYNEEEIRISDFFFEEAEESDELPEAKEKGEEDEQSSEPEDKKDFFDKLFEEID